MTEKLRRLVLAVYLLTVKTEGAPEFVAASMGRQRGCNVVDDRRGYEKTVQAR